MSDLGPSAVLQPLGRTHYESTCKLCEIDSSNDFNFEWFKVNKRFYT
jgi:hypothetical protein